MKLTRFLRAAALLGALVYAPILPARAGKADREQRPAPVTPPLHGSLDLKSMPFSPLIKRKETTWVYLPPGYAQSNQRYPVIYVLHGQPGGWTDCYRSGRVEEMADTLISSGQMPPVILVAFDGNGPRGLRDFTNFCNRADGFRMEDFIASDLVRTIDSTYRTIPDAAHRGIWGYSSGGYGALNLGIKHPDVFNVICSHAGFYNPDGDAAVMQKILGPKGPNWDANDTLIQAQKLPPNAPLHFYIDASPNEDQFAQFQGLVSELKAKNVDVDTDVLQKAHAWRLIVSHCRESLLFAGAAFGKAGAGK